jgi:hypothetical protein
VASAPARELKQVLKTTKMILAEGYYPLRTKMILTLLTLKVECLKHLACYRRFVSKFKYSAEPHSAL